MARQALIILGRSLMDLWDNIFVIVVANLVWAASLAPAIAVASLLGGWPGLAAGLALVILVAAPVALALFALTAYVDRREKLELIDFWRACREHYRRGWLLGALNALFAALAIVNIVFYSSSSFSNTPLPLVTYLWFYLGFIWFSMQLYMWPLAVRMEPLRPVGLLRNTFLATFKYALLSLILSFVLGIFLLASTLLAFVPVVLFGAGLFAVVGNKALALVLEREKERAGPASPAASYRVDAPALPDKTAAAAAGSAHPAPPGVLRRGQGAEGWPEDDRPARKRR